MHAYSNTDFSAFTFDWCLYFGSSCFRIYFKLRLHQRTLENCCRENKRPSQLMKYYSCALVTLIFMLKRMWWCCTIHTLPPCTLQLWEEIAEQISVIILYAILHSHTLSISNETLTNSQCVQEDIAAEGMHLLSLGEHWKHHRIFDHTHITRNYIS